MHFVYRFNIWNTGHDMNFDRIAHLVKLVFSTRIVALSLVDGTEEYVPSFLYSLWILSMNAGFSSRNVGVYCRGFMYYSLTFNNRSWVWCA